jgi:hypothetical protein
MAMNSGPEKLSILPHESTAVSSQGCGEDAKRLKESKSRNGCMGTCMTERAREPQSKRRVPWISACSERSRESRRNAFLDSVASVNGKKIRIWRTVESLREVLLA